MRPSFRGKGLGMALIKSVVEIAKEHGCSEINWQTRVSNEVAHSLYEKIAERTDLIPYRIVLK